MRTAHQLIVKIIATLILAVTQLCSAADFGIKETSEQLSKLLGKEWTISTSDTAIVVESTFDIWMVRMISRPNDPPKFVPSTGVEELSREAGREHYIIRLEYGPLVGRQEFEKLLLQRKQYSDVLAYGTNKGDWNEALSKYGDLRVPRYQGSGFSIFRVTPDRPVLQVYPVSAVAKIGAAKELMDAVLYRHVTPYD